MALLAFIVPLLLGIGKAIFGSAVSTGIGAGLSAAFGKKEEEQKPTGFGAQFGANLPGSFYEGSTPTYKPISTSQRLMSSFNRRQIV